MTALGVVILVGAIVGTAGSVYANAQPATADPRLPLCIAFAGWAAALAALIVI